MTVRVPDLTIQELHLPKSMEDADGGEFRELCAVLDAVALGTWGNLDRASSARARLAAWQDTPYWSSRNFVARSGGGIVGHASCEFPLKDNVDAAWLCVDVLEEYRGQGIGTALLRMAEEASLKQGRHVLQAETADPRGAPGRDLLQPATGIGGVPKDGPGTIFCLKNGYSLEQASRFSVLDLGRAAGKSTPGESAPARSAPDGSAPDAGHPDWDSLEQAARSKPADYDVLTWANRCPEEYVDQMAVLMGRMSTDTPAGGLEIEAEVWDAARVRQREETVLDGGQHALVAAARHRQTGELCAYTVLYLDPDEPWLAEQDDTLVAAPHRGKRLGMLVKLANLRSLLAGYAAVERVMTFNAEENDHMLAINVQLGFRAAGYDGEWQKRIK
ncbi:GNAT family N-acetyltransferase [bacterium RCC_150]